MDKLKHKDDSILFPSTCTFKIWYSRPQKNAFPKWRSWVQNQYWTSHLGRSLLSVKKKKTIIFSSSHLGETLIYKKVKEYNYCINEAVPGMQPVSTVHLSLSCTDEQRRIQQSSWKRKQKNNEQQNVTSIKIRTSLSYYKKKIKASSLLNIVGSSTDSDDEIVFWCLVGHCISIILQTA